MNIKNKITNRINCWLMFALLTISSSYTFANCPTVATIHYDANRQMVVGTDTEGNTWDEDTTTNFQKNGGLTSKIALRNVTIGKNGSQDSPLLVPHFVYCDYYDQDKPIVPTATPDLTLHMFSPVAIIKDSEWKKLLKDPTSLQCEKSTEKTSSANQCQFSINVTYCPSPEAIKYNNKQRTWDADGLNGDGPWSGKVTKQNSTFLTLEGTVPDKFISFLGATISVSPRGDNQPPLYPKIFCYYADYKPITSKPVVNEMSYEEMREMIDFISLGPVINLWKSENAYFGEENGNDKTWLSENVRSERKTKDFAKAFERYLDFATKVIILSPQYKDDNSDLERHKPPVNLIDGDYSGTNQYNGNDNRQNPQNIWRRMKYEKNGKLILACFNPSNKFCPVILSKKGSVVADKDLDQKKDK